MYLAKNKIINTIFSTKKSEFIFFDFLCWFILGIIFPASTGNLSVINIVLFFIYLSAVYYAGERLLSKIDAIVTIPFLFKSGIYIICGSIICGVVYLLLPYNIILYAGSLLFFIDLFKHKRIIYSFSFYNFLCLIPFFIILFQTYELAYATGERFNHNDGDFYYYTAITESLKVNHSISNAIYHTGLPINYSCAPFLAPAQLAKFTGMPAQFALWGVYLKILPIVCLGTIAFSAVKLYTILFNKVLNAKAIIKYQILAAFMFLLLGPMHFLNVLKLDFKNVLFLGEGYVLPIGSPGFSLSMYLSALILLLVFSKPTYSIPHRLFIIFFLGIITASKIALFIPLAILLGSLSVIWLIKKRYDLFITLLLALPFCAWIYIVTVSGNDSATALSFTRDGYYNMLFSNLAGKYGINGSPGYKIILMLCISITMWLSIKLFIFSISTISLFKSNKNALALIAAGIISFIICLLPGFFINFHSIVPYGQTALDYRFDMTQFTRGSIFLLMIITLIFALFLVDGHTNRFIRTASLSFFILWMCTMSYSFAATDFKKALVIDQSWYNEVRIDFIKQKPSLMVALGSGDYSGQVLTSAGVYPWYCTGLQFENEGFLFTLRGINRNLFFQKIFDSTLLLSNRKAVADSIKKEGVDCIVGSPSSTIKLQFAEKDSLISRIAGTKWFYKIN